MYHTNWGKNVPKNGKITSIKLSKDDLDEILKRKDEEYKARLQELEEDRNLLEKLKNTVSLPRQPPTGYHQPGIAAQIDSDLSEAEIKMLIEKGIRTFLVQLADDESRSPEKVIKRLKKVVESYMLATKSVTPIGIAIEMVGEALRIGRLRNNKRVFIKPGDKLVLTSDVKYIECGFKEIVYFHNLWQYAHLCKIDDIVILGYNQVKLRVVKVYMDKRNSFLITCIEQGEYLDSFMDALLPFPLPDDFNYFWTDKRDIEFAIKHGAKFLVFPFIKGLKWYTAILSLVQSISNDIFIVCGIHSNFADKIDICDMKKMFVMSNAVLFYDYFVKYDENENLFITTEKLIEVAKLAKQFHLPVIAYIPIETKNDFDILENNSNLKLIDTYLIRRSPKTKTYPLIVKKLEPIQELFKCSENIERKLFTSVEELCNSSQSVLEMESPKKPSYKFLNNVSYLLSCRRYYAIVITSFLQSAFTVLFSTPEIYCPVIAVMKNVRTATLFNLYRNLKTVIYYTGHTDMIDKERSVLHYGIKFGQKMNYFNVGQLILTLVETHHDGNLVNKFQSIHVPIYRIHVEPADEYCEEEETHEKE